MVFRKVALLFVVLSGGLFAQISQSGVTHVISDPIGKSCSTGSAPLFNFNGAVYSCQAGAYALPPGGSTTVLAGATQGPGGSNTLNSAQADVLGVTSSGLPLPYSYVQGATGSGGRTQTSKNQDIISLGDFHPTGNGIVDDTAHVQAWVNAITPQSTNVGGYGYCPSGTYLLTGTITIQNTYGLVLMGSTSCTFKWGGASNIPMFDLQDVAHSLFIGFKVLGDSGHQLASAFLLENIIGTAVTPTSDRFENIFIYGVNGYIDYGFRISGTGTGGDNNNDFHQFVNVHVNNYAISGWSLEASQGHFIRMHDSWCFGNGTGKYCVSSGSSAGANTSFVWDGGFTGGNTGADFALTCNTSAQPYVLKNLSSEGSNRLIDSPGGNCGSGSALVINAVRFADNGLNADGRAIIYSNPGPVSVVGSTIGELMSNAVKIHWTYAASFNPPGFVMDSTYIKGTLGTVSGIFDGNVPTQLSATSAVTSPTTSTNLDLINVNGFKVTNDGTLHLDFGGLAGSFDSYPSLSFSGWTAYPNLFDFNTALQMDWNSDVMLSYAGAGTHRLRVTDRFDTTKFYPFEAEVITSHGTGSDPGCAGVVDVGKFWTDTTTTTTALKYCKSLAGVFSWSSIVLP